MIPRFAEDRLEFSRKGLFRVKMHSLLLEVRPLSVSDTLDVSGTYLKIKIEPNRIILKFRFATIQIRQKYDLYRIRIAIWKKKLSRELQNKINYKNKIFFFA